MIKQKLFCNICGQEFSDSYGMYGAIHHDNRTNKEVMTRFVKKYIGALNNEREKYKLFLDSITLYGNFDGIKDNSIDIGLQVFKCRIIWLKENGYDDIAEYLESNRVHIASEFNKITSLYIDEKQHQIKSIEYEIEELKQRMIKEEV